MVLGVSGRVFTKICSYIVIGVIIYVPGGPRIAKNRGSGVLWKGSKVVLLEGPR